MDETLGTNDLVTDTLTYRRVDYMCRVGLIPGQEQRLGSGTQRRFTPAQVRRVRALHRLTDAGLDLSIAAVADTRALHLGTTRLMFLGPGLTLVMTDLS